MRLTIRRFEASGLTWPLPDDVTDTMLEARPFAKAGSGSRQGQRRLTESDLAAVHRELKREHVTLSIVWEEYIAGESDAGSPGRTISKRLDGHMLVILLV